MNRIYRTVWSKRLGTMVAVSEHAHSQGKGSRAGARVLAGVLACTGAPALACNASDTGTLAACVANAATDGTIDLTGNITLTGNIGVLAASARINGNGFTLDGANTFRGFFVGAGSVNINNVTLQNLRAQGGKGGDGSAGGGGGGLGAGAAVFVRSGAAVVLDSVLLVSNTAAGGAGGNALGGGADQYAGGGGMGGAGGGNGSPGTASSGHGGGGLFASGGLAGSSSGGAGGGPNGGTAGASFSAGGAGGDYSGGGGAGNFGSNGGAGGFAGGGGGGGGGGSARGGTGGFGGGAGAGILGGNGGFGGGGGSTFVAGFRGAGGFGGGNGGVFNGGSGPAAGGSGGGGAGMGGAVFVQDGGSLTTRGSTSLSGNAVSAGVAPGFNAGSGSAFGSGIFLQGSGAVLTFDPGAGNVQTVQNAIADQTGSGGAGANAGSVAITKNGAGTLQLTADNTYSGGTTISAGTVQVGNGGTSGTLGSGPVANNGALVFNRGNNVTQAAPISGSGSLAQIGSGTTILSGANTYSGTTSVSAGTLQAGATNTFSANSAVNLTGGTLGLNSFDQSIGALSGAADSTVSLGTGTLTTTMPGISTFSTYAGTITGTGGLTLNGAFPPNQLILTGNSTYSGTTTVNATLQIGDGGSRGSIGAGTIVLGSPGRLVHYRRDDAILTNTFAGTGSLVKEGSGRLTLTGSNAFEEIDIRGGALAIGAGANLGSTDAAIVLRGGTLRTAAGTSLTSGGTLSLHGRSGVAADTGATLTFTGQLIASVSGETTFGTAGQSGTIVLANSSSSITQPSTLTVAGGTLRAGTGNATLGQLTSGTTSTTVNTGATLDFNGTSGTVTRLLGGGTLATGSATGNSISLGNDSSFAGVIQGGGNLATAGNATVTLSGANTYSGTTTIASGSVLRVGAGSASGTLGTGAVIDDGELVFNRSGNVTVANAISGSGSLTQAGSGTTVLSGANTYGGTTSVTAGTLRAGAANTFSVRSDIDLAGTGTLDLNNFDQTIGTLSGSADTTVSLGSGTLTTTIRGIGPPPSTYAGTITGSGGLTLNGGPGSTLILTGDSTYSGTTTVNAALQIGEGGTSGSIGAGTIAMAPGGGATLIHVRSDDAILANTITGSGSLLKDGAGQLTLTGSNGFNQIIVYGGTLAIGAGSNLGSRASIGIVQGSTLRAAAGTSLTTDGNLTLIGPSRVTADTGATLTFTANLLQSGDALFGTAGQSGTVVLANSSSSIRQPSTLTVAGGTLRAGAGNATLGQLTSGTTSTTVNTGATLDFNGTSGTITKLLGGGTLATGSATDNTISLGNDSSFAGVIQGGGNLATTADAAVTLSGTNTYTGTTTIASGSILRVGTGGASGRLGAGAVIDDGQLVFNHSGTLTVANAISGTGSLTQAGTGTTVLTGNNSYAGTTTVAAGTLQVGDDGTTGTLGTGAVTNNASLVFNRSNAATVANAIAGTGTLTQAGAGTLTVTGDNTYSGGTTVNAGRVLQVGAGGATGHLGTGNIGNDGTLIVSRSGTLTIAATVNGAGSLVQAGPGTTVLAADSTYSGGTTISGGTLQVGAGGTSGALGTGGITNNGALVFKRSDAVTLATGMAGTGSFTQAGSGNLVLSGTHTYTGGTFVDDGTLSVNGAIVGHTTVNSGGTLGGTGRTGSVAVAGGGVLSPGNSIGTLTVDGNLTFAPGSTYRVEANAAGAADRVNAVGSGSLTINGGTVDVRATGAGYQRNTSYTILSSAGPATGRFDNATTNLAFLTPTLLYEANAVLLNLNANGAVQYATVARTPNQASVATYLTGFADAPGNPTAAGLIQQIDSLTADQARAAFDALAGTPHAAASQVAGAVGRNFSATLAARSGFTVAAGPATTANFAATRYASLSPALQEPDAPVSDAPRFAALDTSPPHTEPGSAAQRGFWVQALGSSGRVDSDGNGAGSSYGGGGFVFGYDQPVDAQWRAGAAFGYSRTSWHASNNGASPASGKVESSQAGLYARYTGAPWLVHLDATFGEHRFVADRSITIGGPASTAHSTHRGREWALGTQVEYPVQWGDWQLRPLAGLRHARLREQGFSESGAGAANLSMDARSTSNTLVSAGARFIRQLAQGRGGVELRAVASRLLGDNDSPVSARLAGQSASFAAGGTALERNALTLGTTLTGELARGLTGYADANYERRGSGQNAFQLSVGVRKSW